MLKVDINFGTKHGFKVLDDENPLTIVAVDDAGNHVYSGDDLSGAITGAIILKAPLAFGKTLKTGKIPFPSKG